jgi:hypothetical protein
MLTIKPIIQDIPAMLFLEYQVKMKFGLWFVARTFLKIKCEDGDLRPLMIQTTLLGILAVMLVARVVAQTCLLVAQAEILAVVETIQAEILAVVGIIQRAIIKDIDTLGKIPITTL